MKKTKLIIIFLALALIFSLAACGNNDGEKECAGHVDADNDLLCDLCGAAGCYNHADYNGDRRCEFCGVAMPCGDNHTDDNTDGKCDRCGENMPCETHVDSALDGSCDICEAQIETITVAEALELCGESGNITSDRYYIRATVKTVSSYQYGSMVLEDETGSISVYGTYSHDGVLTFAQLESAPQRGDEVLLHCILQNYNGSKEVKNARLVGFVHKEADVSEYTAMTVADARDAEDGSLVIVEGVVAKITFANGMKPAGVILVDGTQSIYVYGADVAGAVEVGNKVKVAGVKDHWILDTETNNAQKFGYEGCNQLSDAFMIENYGGSHEFDKSWISETTVKAIMDTPASEDITSTIFKVTALVKKVDGTGFTNYYIDDLDETTGSYVYTQCNGSDFAWLDEFDGKICTVYLTAINAKCSTSGYLWRFIPVAVIDEGFVFDVSNAPEFAVDYYGVTALQQGYMPGAKVELPVSVSSELLGFEGATLTYTSSDNTVITVSVVDGVTVMQAVAEGNATVTVKGTHSGNEYETAVEITVTTAESYDSLNVSEAIAAEIDTEVTVQGVVGPSLVNKTGFYLIDESGLIAVTGANTIFDGLSIGDKVVVKGTRTVTKSGEGQIVIENAEILANYYGEYKYPTATFIADKTIEEIRAITDTAEATVNVFIVTSTVKKVVNTNSINYYVGEIMLYSGDGGQYAWLDSFFEEGATETTLTLELALCDWNAKGLKGCVLAVYNEDGTKTYNTLNFN